MHNRRRFAPAQQNPVYVIELESKQIAYVRKFEFSLFHSSKRETLELKHNFGHRIAAKRVIFSSRSESDYVFDWLRLN